MTSSEDKPRGSAGKFISEEQAKNLSEKDLKDLIYKSSKMTGALKTIKEAKENEEFDKPLVSVSVNNPISWFMKWLNQLKKKQTTTINLKFGIPLIALPVLITALAGLFFGLGRFTKKDDTTIIEKPPEYYQTSKVGLLKNIPNGQTQNYYLIMVSGEAILLEITEGVDMVKLINKRILITGKYYSGENLFKVENVADVEVLPTTPKPIPTIEPTSTPISSPSISPLPTGS